MATQRDPVPPHRADHPNNRNGCHMNPARSSPEPACGMRATNCARCRIRVCDSHSVCRGFPTAPLARPGQRLCFACKRAEIFRLD